MRKWKCVEVNDKRYLTLGKIYETNNEGLDYTIDDGFHFMHINIKELDYGKFEEIKEDRSMKREFKVGDIIKGTNSYKYTWTNEHMTKGEVVEVKCGFRNSEIKVKIIEHTKDPSKVGMLYIVYPEHFELIDTTSKTITITTSDTITTLTDGIHTTTVNRYHTDKHNERNAVNSVIDKYYDELKQIEIENNMPKVGDMVRVVDKGCLYSTNYIWLEENNVPLKTAIKWKYDNRDIDDKEYKVVCIHKHDSFDSIKALIEDEYNAFIIGIEGLEVVR